MAKVKPLSAIRTLNTAVDERVYNEANGVRAANSLTWQQVIEQALQDWIDTRVAPVSTRKRGGK